MQFAFFTKNTPQIPQLLEQRWIPSDGNSLTLKPLHPQCTTPCPASNRSPHQDLTLQRHTSGRLRKKGCHPMADPRPTHEGNGGRQYLTCLNLTFRREAGG